MKKIKEIKSIEINVNREDETFYFAVNRDRSKGGYEFRITADNARLIARCLTKLANYFWNMFDAYSGRKDENESTTEIEEKKE